MNREKYLPLSETTYYILLSLLKPNHGYLIMQQVQDLSNHSVNIAAGTLYGAIENLIKEKFIVQCESEDSRRKTYVITETGKSLLMQDCNRMKHMIAVTNKLIQGE